MTARVALLLAWVAFCLAVAATFANIDQRDTLDRVEHRLDLLETTTTVRPVRAQAGQPSRPTTTIGACVVDADGFHMWTSEADAARAVRAGGRRCGQ